MAGWKFKFLSFSGRVTLIKSVLTSLPIYFMSLFKMPEKIASELDKIQARFLWGSCDQKRKVHLVHWDKVTCSEEESGLGIRKFRIMNEFLMLK